MAEIYAYLNAGEGETGTGVIGTMNKIWQEQRPYQENMGNQNASWNRRSALDAIPGQAIANRFADPRNCSELPMMMGARSATGGGGGGSRASRGATEAVIAKQMGGTKPNDVAHAAALYGGHKAGGYCTSEDANYVKTDDSVGDSRQGFDCLPGDTKKMPDGDARVQSILRPAHDYTDPNAIKQYGTSLTFNNGAASLPIGDQAKAADDAIATIAARFSPPTLPKDVEQTPSGKILLTKVKAFNARVSPAIEAMSSAAARLNASKNGIPAAQVASLLADFQAVYGRLFPGSPVPSNVSEEEVMRYEVLRRFADPSGNWLKTLNATGDAARVGQIQAQTQAVELQLLYTLNERANETNMLLSALVAQSVNPITRQEIDNLAHNAQK